MPDTVWLARNLDIPETYDGTKHGRGKQKSMNLFLMMAGYTCRPEPNIIVIRGFTQQQMGADTKTHSKTLGRAQGVLHNRSGV